MLDRVLQDAKLRQRLGRLQRAQGQAAKPVVPIYLGVKGGWHELLVGDKVERVPQSKVITRGALVVGEPVSFVQGFLDGLSGD
jgi:hypothetical protein